MTVERPEPGGADPRPELSLRASDADRETYVKVLREAYAEGRLDGEEYEERMDAAYRARTYGDLLPLLADLPTTAAGVPVVPLPAAAAAATWQGSGAPVAAGHGGATGPIMAIFGGTERRGGWLVPAELPVVAVFGGVELDLTAATFAAPVVELKAVAVFGGVEITVPEGLRLEVEGVGIFGGFSHQAGDEGDPGAPLVRITGVAFFGGVEVKRGPRRAAPAPPAPPSISPPPAG